jgi:hypothetical protein
MTALIAPLVIAVLVLLLLLLLARTIRIVPLAR